MVYRNGTILYVFLFFGNNSASSFLALLSYRFIYSYLTHMVFVRWQKTYLPIFVFAPADECLYAESLIFSHDHRVKAFLFGYKVHKCHLTLAFCGLAFIVANYNGFYECTFDMLMSQSICAVYLLFVKFHLIISAFLFSLKINTDSKFYA